MYKSAVFLGAFLMFAVQPMVGRAVLPLFGGGAGVWLACMMFFQLVLLAGYGYAHGLVVRVAPAKAIRLHGAVLFLAVVSLAGALLWGGAPWLPNWNLPGAHIAPPQLAIPVVLGLTCGLPLLALSTTSPLVQAIYSRIEGREPYPLYAVSNWGSLAGLLTYPLLLEPSLGLRVQAWIATFAFLVYCGLILALQARAARAEAGTTAAEPARSTGKVEALRWVGLATLGSVWLLAISNLLSVVVASMPLMWIPPLALYLGSFIWAFDARRSPRNRLVLFLGIFSILAFILFGAFRYFSMAVYQVGIPSLSAALDAFESFRARDWIQSGSLKVVLALIALFFACTILHGRLRELKPEPARLTAFYFWISVGGALGGILVGVVAPLVFSQDYELLLALGASSLLALMDFRVMGKGWGLLGMVPASLSLALSAVDLGGRLTNLTEFHARDFFGIVSVRRPHPNVLTMVHGNTRHGLELIKDPRRPTAYYGPESGYGRVVRNLQATRPALRIGIVGLGVGNVAAYSRAEDHTTFYEISPKVIRLSGVQGTHFSVLRNCLGPVKVLEGDGRKLLEEEVDREPLLDLLLVDAFAGGHIPAHLLTREAIEGYFRRLRPDGVLVLHVSHHLPVPLVAGAGLRDLGLTALKLPNRPMVVGKDSRGNLVPLEFGSTFWAAARSGSALLVPELLDHASRLVAPEPLLASLRPADQERAKAFQEESRHVRSWTDERNSLTDLLVYTLRAR